MAQPMVIAQSTRSAEALLCDRDYTIIMAKTLVNPVAPPPGFTERWLTAQSSILELAQTCENFHPEGITLYLASQTADHSCTFLRHDRVQTPAFEALVEANQAPKTITLAKGLQAALDEYFERKTAGQAQANGQIILIVLDGEPEDRMAIANVIVQATHKIDRNEELGIGFVQIGEDPIAQGFFEMLDDHLEEVGAKYDIVDAKILSTIERDSLTKFLLDTLFD
ncbi:MAG: hypothetical protein AAGD25_36785 [Cyanobacteria bacterium P01_F01_bin.150]